MINQAFEILNLHQRKIQTPLFRNAREAFKSNSSHQKYHAKYLVVDSIQRLPQKIFMQNNICPVFIYSSKSYIFQEGISLFQYFLSKKDTDVVLCEQQIWKLLQQITRALILLREAGYEHRHIKEYAIRRLNTDNYKLVFHPSMITPQEHIQQRNYNWYDFYLSPEQLQNFSHEEATTCIFSFGCMILNLMNPLDFKRDIYSRSQYSISSKIVEEKLENASRLYSRKIVDIVKNMLVQEHEQRLTLHELLTLIQKYIPFGKKVQLTSFLKNMVSSRMAKSKEKTNSPPKQSFTQNQHLPSNKPRNQIERSPVISFQRGTFGGHREDTSNEKEKKEHQQNQTLHTKQSLINSRAKELDFKEEQSSEERAKRSYSQYFAENNVKKWNKKEKSAKHSLIKEEVREVGDQLRVTRQKGKIKVDININQIQDRPIGYNEYIIKTADKKRIKVGLSRLETENDRFKQFSKVQSSGNKNQSFPNPTKPKENQTHKDSDSIEHSVIMLKSRLDNYHLKLAECLEQPLSIAKKLGYQGVWINGNVYYGQFKNGRRNGLALQIFQNKEYYYGHYREDMFHGEGFYYWSANEHFLGMYQAGCKKEGTWWGKNKYTGEIKDNMRHGIGSCFYANGKIYQGEWFMGKRHGSGIIIEPSGEKFIGTFKTGNKWGQGTYLLEGCRVIGIWDGENAIDQVEIMYQNGRLYKGFINKYFEMHGKGELKFSNGSICRGNFQNGDFVFGEMVYQNGETYVGEIKDFRRHGRGTYSYNDGRQVTAQWVNNKNVGIIKD